MNLEYENKIRYDRLVCINGIEYDLNKHLLQKYENCEFLDALNEQNFINKKVHLNYFKAENKRPGTGYVLPTEEGILIFNGIKQINNEKNKKSLIRQYDYIKMPFEFINTNSIKSSNSTLKKNNEIYCFFRLENNKYWFTLGSKSYFIVDNKIILEDETLILENFKTIEEWYNFSLIKIGKKNFDNFSEKKIETFELREIRDVNPKSKNICDLKEELKTIIILKKINEKLGGILKIED